MNLRSDERLIEIMLAKIDHVQKCSKRVCRMGLGGVISAKRVNVPEDSPVRLLSLLPIDHTGKKTKGLSA